MGFLRELFGPSREEVWSQLCDQIGAQYVSGGFWKGDKVIARYGPWTITLDTYTVSSNDTSTTYTRMRAPYVNKDGFRFTICRHGFFSGNAAPVVSHRFRVQNRSADESVKGVSKPS